MNKKTKSLALCMAFLLGSIAPCAAQTTAPEDPGVYSYTPPTLNTGNGGYKGFLPATEDNSRNRSGSENLQGYPGVVVWQGDGNSGGNTRSTYRQNQQNDTAPYSYTPTYTPPASADSSVNAQTATQQDSRSKRVYEYRERLRQEMEKRRQQQGR